MRQRQWYAAWLRSVLLTLTLGHLTLTLAVVASCRGQHGKTPAPLAAADPGGVPVENLPAVLDLRLSSGHAGVPAPGRAKLATARRLPDADADALIRRARPIAPDAQVSTSVALRAASQPPPRTGRTLAAAFPPPPGSQRKPPAGDAGATTGDLRVVRSAPEGRVPVAPELSVTFSQPMVAVTSASDAAQVTPVRLSPQPPGAWRWIGTRTIVFAPVARFPQATTYAVEIPAGTRSATGGRLKQPTKLMFETPPPTIVSHFPDGSPQRVDVPMFVVFDQKIDPQAVIARISVTAEGKPQAIRRVDADECAADPRLAPLVVAARQAEQDGRWLAFRAAHDLPRDAAIEVAIAAGTPSAEGPNPTREVQRYEFRTFAPLGITAVDCGYSGHCRPGSPLRITFNNPLDADRFDDGQLVVAPAIADLKIEQRGNQVSVTGMTAARTRYTVRLSSGVVDELGQALGEVDPVSWNVGDAAPALAGPGEMVVVDPGTRRPAIDVFTMGYAQLAVKLYAVTPGDYDAFCAALRAWRDHGVPPRFPGKQVVDGKLAIGRGDDQLVETHVDVAPALAASGLGHAIAIVEPYPWTDQASPPPRVISWVQSTRLGIDAHVDREDLVAFATELATGKRAAGVALEIRPHGITGTTDARGLATLALGPPRKGAPYLVARKGDDVAFVAEPAGAWLERDGWSHTPHAQALAWYVADDRGLYRPGEAVSLKGWLRTIDDGKRGDVGGVAGLVSSVTYRVTDATGDLIASGAARVSPLGGFDATFTLPGTPNLGHAEITFEAQGRLRGSHRHWVRIEEFRRPELELAIHASAGPQMIGGGGDVTVQARSFTGGPLPGAAVRWEVSAAQTRFTPPNRDDYRFGSWLPWWSATAGDDGDGGSGRHDRWASSQLAATTDATGAHTLHLDFAAVRPALPMSVVARAEVTDVNRQTWSTWSELLVHPASRYVGLRPRAAFVAAGAPFEVDVIGVDLDGNPAVGARIEVAAVRLDRRYRRGKRTTMAVDRQTCEVVASQAAVPCAFSTRSPGEYQLTATIVDAAGRANRTQLMFWVSGGAEPPARDLAPDKVRLIADHESYAPGTTAHLLIHAPFSPAEGVVSWRRSGIIKTFAITLDGPTAVIEVPISDAMVPNLHVQVDLVGTAARTDDHPYGIPSHQGGGGPLPPARSVVVGHGAPDPALPRRPAYAVGTIDLAVPPSQRTLQVKVWPRMARLGPGETTQLELAVADTSGKPVANAEVAVIVVDEAILALTGYELDSPSEVFYRRRDAGAHDVYSRAYLQLARPDAMQLRWLALGSRTGDASELSDEELAMLAEQEAKTEVITVTGRLTPFRHSAPAAARLASTLDLPGLPGPPGPPGPPAPQGASSPIAVRSDFRPLAAFSPAVHTDVAGKATVLVKLPDSLTRYRVMAIAVAGDSQFGKGESAITARLPLMVRPSPPRFLNFGDTFQLPVVVHNQTDAAMTVQLAVRATNATLTDGAGRELSVPPNDRVEVRFAVAAVLAGTARFQIVATAGRGPRAPSDAPSDAAELAVPVWTPATTEAFATYGVIDDGPGGPGGVLRQPVALPVKALPQLGGLEVTTAATQLGALTDALRYLVHYPFECAEQRASRVFAIAALKDVLSAFRTRDLPSAAALTASVAADVEQLSRMQNADGGFAFWSHEDPSQPYLTVYVTAALAHARARGFPVAPEILEHAGAYLRDIAQHYPASYGQDVRWAISAYALYTRKQLGDLDVARARQLITGAGGVDKLTMEAAGWLLGALAGSPAAATERAAIVRHALNQVSETTGAASFTTGHGDGDHVMLASDHRVDAVMLEALILEATSGGAAAHAVSDLIPKIVTGLLAHRTAGRWLNTQDNTFALVALDRYFRTYEKATPDFVARVWLGSDRAGDHAFKGRTTDSHAIDIAMRDVASHDGAALTIQKAGKGRLYYRIAMTYAPASLALAAADHGFVVERRYEAVDRPSDVTRASDGAWHIKAGARVRVQLTMVNDRRRYHVALVDPLPAGLEALNPALAVTGPIPDDPARQAGARWDGSWYEHQNLRDERVEAFASLVREGVHHYDYVARATTPGSFVVPPVRAEEMYMPETFGRAASDRVVIE